MATRGWHHARSCPRQPVRRCPPPGTSLVPPAAAPRRAAPPITRTNSPWGGCSRKCSGLRSPARAPPPRSVGHLASHGHPPISRHLVDRLGRGDARGPRRRGGCAPRCGVLRRARRLAARGRKPSKAKRRASNPEATRAAITALGPGPTTSGPPRCRPDQLVSGVGDAGVPHRRRKATRPWPPAPRSTPPSAPPYADDTT